MSDDLSKVEFGEPIECRGQKPDGFPTGRVPVQWSYNGRPYLDVTADDCRNFGMPHEPVLIRLPIEVPCNSKAPSDDIAKRMEALVRELAGNELLNGRYATEARAIVALLPEPVDADLVEAREICLRQAIDEGCDEADMYHHYSKATVEGNASVRLAVTCIRRGRALERDSREG